MWEDCKENLLPVKRGRNVNDIFPVTECKDEFVISNDDNENIPKKSKSLPLGTKRDLLKDPIPSKNQKIEMKFESDLADFKMDGEKLLEIYLAHYSWLRRRVGDNLQACKQLIERGTKQLSSFPDLKNHVNYVKLWIDYADLVSDSNDVFNYMNSNEIGKKVSLFWLAWAFVAEKDSNYNLADKLYNTGLRYQAEPKKLLAQRYKEFQRRVARKYINQFGLGEETSVPSPADALVALTAANAPPQPLAVSTTSASTGATGFPIKSSGSLSKKGVTTDNKASIAIPVFNEIFDDGIGGLPIVEPALGASSKSSGWMNLGTENQRTKENKMPLNKWSDAPLHGTSGQVPQSATASITIPGAHNTVIQQSNTTSLEIFEDEEFAATNAPKQQTQVKRGLGGVIKQTDSVSVPAKPPVVPAAKAPSFATTNAVPQVSTSNNAAISMSLSDISAIPPTDDTINTRLALEDLESMFNSPPKPIMMKKGGRENLEPQKSSIQESVASVSDDDLFESLDTYKSRIKYRYFSELSQPTIQSVLFSQTQQSLNAHFDSRDENLYSVAHRITDGALPNINDKYTRNSLTRNSNESPVSRVESLKSSCKTVHEVDDGAGAGAKTAEAPASLYISPNNSSVMSMQRVQVIEQEDSLAIQERITPSPCKMFSYSNTLFRMKVVTNDASERDTNNASTTKMIKDHLSGSAHQDYPIVSIDGLKECVSAETEAQLPSQATNLTSNMNDVPVISLSQQTLGQQACTSEDILMAQTAVPYIKDAQSIHPHRITVDSLSAKSKKVRKSSNNIGYMLELQAFDRAHATNPTLSLNFSRIIASGTYGIAVQVIDSKTKEEYGLKIGRASSHKTSNERNLSALAWEAFIHSILYTRLQTAETRLKEAYEAHVVRPLALYNFSDTSAILMPYLELGTIVQVLPAMKRRLNTKEQEIVAIFLAKQMIQAIQAIHSAGILHCDIKSDNWVLTSKELRKGEKVSLRICMIDFGKAKFAQLWQDHKFSENSNIMRILYDQYHLKEKGVRINEFIAYNEKVSAQSYVSPREDRGEKWIYQTDYYGLCACIHQLIFFERLTTIEESRGLASLRGFQINDSLDKSEKVFVPKSNLKRYWDQKCWSCLYETLLNPPKLITSQANLDALATEMQSFLDNVPPSRLEDILTRLSSDLLMRQTIAYRYEY